jgi:hypothetical protein
LQGSTVSYQRTIGQADTESRANLGAFNSEGVVVLAVYVACEYQIVLKDFERLTGNHVNGKKAISHDNFLKVS